MRHKNTHTDCFFESKLKKYDSSGQGNPQLSNFHSSGTQCVCNFPWRCYKRPR
jgi:hypothetical protein